MKLKRARGYDPLPKKADSAEELLEKFMANLIKDYNEIKRSKPFAAEPYVISHLKRIRHLDPETRQEGTSEQQEDTEERLLKMFYRLLSEYEETGKFSLEMKDKRLTDS
jgi:hypothetical protein